ncbi:MAG: hypothetical protein NT105_15095 [Verrucomicrobia bacterium]|nr:hypothetical protein [Verrucomicrobiota bacterium]
MKTKQTMKSWTGLAVCLGLAAVVQVPAPSEAAPPPRVYETTESGRTYQPVVVGRVYHIEGELLRYVPAAKDWVATVNDAPFGVEDTLFSGKQGMAELFVPNGTRIRIGYSTQVQFIGLEGDLTEVDVASGVARFYNKSPNAVIKATSSFGYVLAEPGAAFDFYVGENSAEVIPINGKVTFIHAGTEAKYDVAAGAPSILADAKQVASGDGAVEPGWNSWNATREAFWAERANVRGHSAEYLPPDLQNEAYVFEEHGRWDRINYEGQERIFWRPTHVAAGWAPYTVGRWTEWYGDQTWIPAEPFGYMTHHYGNWVYVGNSWCWAPPVMGVRVGLPFLDVGFYWNPGRVSWIHSGGYVGWVPLGYRETYYGHRSWGGPHSRVASGVSISLSIGGFAYASHAVIINQRDFYGVSNYGRVRVSNISHAALVKNYRAAPVVNNTVIINYSTNRQRYNYTNVAVSEKPHATVTVRIQQNNTVIRKGKPETAVVVQQRAGTIRQGQVSSEARIAQPRITNNIVAARDVNKPKAEMKLQQRELKGRSGQPEAVAAKSAAVLEDRKTPAKLGQPGARPARVKPAAEAVGTKPAQSGAKPEKIQSPRGGRQEQPAQPAARTEKLQSPRNTQPGSGPEKVVSPRGARQEPTVQPAARTQKVVSPKGGQQEQSAQPAVKPEKIQPPRGNQQEQTVQPAARTGKIQSPRGSRQEQTSRPAAKPEKVQSPKQDQPREPSHPAAGAERVKRQDQPAKPSPQVSGPTTAKPKGKQPNQPAQPVQEEKSKENRKQ